ncbi:MAG: Endonuclease III, partial [uncultured Acetobacteraceae bacterium]
GAVPAGPAAGRPPLADPSRALRARGAGTGVLALRRPGRSGPRKTGWPAPVRGTRRGKPLQGRRM